MGQQQTFETRIFEAIRAERQRQRVPEGFPALPEIPGGRYTRQDFFDLEIDHVFRKSWVMAGHVEEVAEPGSYKRFDKLLGTPIIIVRDHEGVIRAFYNTCRHRGAPVVKDDSGRCNVLRCQYHSWAYDLSGRLVNVPDEHDFVDLDKSARGLLPVRCETYRGLIFVNEDPSAMPLLEYMGPLAEEWSETGVEDMRLDYYWSRVIDCNWKCALDAFQEVYHINTLHPKTVGAMLEHSAATMGLMPHGHSRMCVRITGADIDETPPEGWPDGEVYRRTSVAQTLWPSLNVPWSVGTGRFILFWPRSVGQCEIEVIGLGADWGDGPLPEDRVAANANFDHILDEDVRNLEAIQASLDSGAFTGMMLNYQERRIYWSHEEIDRVIGVEEVPEELRVAQLLEPFVESP
ncbi:MAG: aromatic ring-hydroxylating dioxygenase subunit alpha [Gammaproteobacteria bacterium]|nr:aromatic ring-hydroxylating dioxygenase subunit alpha [Gammaproteobacteria bacterium]